MYTRMTTVCNPTGLHARPATEFVNRAKQYKSRITICNPQEEPADTVNAKSVVLVLSLGLAKGSQVEITAQGGWKLADFTTDMAKEKVDSDLFGFSLTMGSGTPCATDDLSLRQFQHISFHLRQELRRDLHISINGIVISGAHGKVEGHLSYPAVSYMINCLQ